MSGVIDVITGHAVIILAAVAIAEGILAAWLLRRNEELRIRLDRARSAADQAARAAALAAPGAIDPELVIHLLRTGQTVTLETVHELMERQEQSAAPVP
jgi:poly-gamma-glutamate capsule biosynthesis protein CapA/YwtB (metallophosphatase superfamily)